MEVNYARYLYSTNIWKLIMPVIYNTNKQKLIMPVIYNTNIWKA